jgi:hypothetical protein
LLQDGGPLLLPRKSKKSFTERLSTRFDRLTSVTSSSRHKASGYNRAYQERVLAKKRSENVSEFLISCDDPRPISCMKFYASELNYALYFANKNIF